MANVKISQLPTATTLTTADLLPIVQGGVTKQVTPDLLPVSTATATALAGKDAAGAATAAQAAAIQRANHTGTQTADTITDGTTNKAYTATERTKLAGIATGATVNRADSATDTAISTAVANLVNAAPTTLDTLGELATQLQSDESAAAALTTLVGQKAPLASPTFTGTVSGISKTMVGLGNVDNTSDVNKPVSTAQAAALTAQRLGGTVNAITSNATAVIGVRNTVDATSAPVTVTLPTATSVGQWLIIERLDASAVNAITISGTIRGVGSSTAVLPAVGVANEGGLWVAETLTSWTPAASIKPKAFLDALYDAKGAATTATANLTAITDNGDGTFGVTGPAVTDNGDGTFTFTSGTVETAYTKTRTDALLTAAQGGIVGINGQTASYTTVLGDAGKLITVTSASATTVTIPLNATVAYPVGTVLSFTNLSTGAVTIAATSGATLFSPAGARITTQYAQASAVKIATDTWLLSGQTVV